MPVSTLTSKGQITIPQEIREELQLRKGQRLEFRLDAKRRLILEPLTNDVRRLRGNRAPVSKTRSLPRRNRQSHRGRLCQAMRGLDINILVRYLSADDPQQCAAAERVIEESIQTGESLLPDGDSPL